MTKLVQNDLTSLTNEQSALAALNSNYALLETFSDTVLSRAGLTPNQMEADLDMNGNQILNLPSPASANEPLRLQDLSTFLGSGAVIAGVSGAASSTDNSIARWDGTLGNDIQNSLITVADDGTVRMPNNIYLTANNSLGVQLNLIGRDSADRVIVGSSVPTNNELRLHSGSTGGFVTMYAGGSQFVRLDTTNGFQIGDALNVSNYPAAAFVVSTGTGFPGGDWTAWFRHAGTAVNNESLIRHQHFSNAQVPLPVFAGQSSRGTVASPTTLSSGDYLLVLDGRGYDGSANNYGEYALGFTDTSAQIALRATQTWSGTAHGSEIVFKVTPNASVTPAFKVMLGQDGNFKPFASDGSALGTTALMWSDLFLADGGVINFNNGGGSITYLSASDSIRFQSATGGYLFDTLVAPLTDDGAALGNTSNKFSDLFLASGGVINFNSGDVTLTHAADTLTFGGAASGYIFDNFLTIPAGTGTETLKPSGLIDINTTNGATIANTTETDLITYTLPANSLSTNGQSIRVTAWGTTAANANNKTMKLYFGSTVLATTGAIALNNGSWKIDYILTRTGATSQKATATILASDPSARPGVSFAASIGETLSGNLTIKVTGQNGTASANDIVANGLMTEYLWI